MGKSYPRLTPSNMRPSRQNVGGRLTKKSKKMRIKMTLLRQSLRQYSLGYPKSLHVKSMHHGSLMEVLVAQGGVLRIRWDQSFFGLRACGRSLSALHADMEGLLRATSCMRDMRTTSICFETDCSDLVDMTTNPMDWPTFATEIEILQRLQEDFEDVSLIHIPRNMNGRADALAKEAGTRGYMFSHIYQIRAEEVFPGESNRLTTT